MRAPFFLPYQVTYFGKQLLEKGGVNKEPNIQNQMEGNIFFTSKSAVYEVEAQSLNLRDYVISGKIDETRILGRFQYFAPEESNE